MSPRPHHRPGFTLMEVLVTMTIGAVLLLLAVQLLGRAGDGYDRGAGSVAAEREARAVLTQMGEDLAKAEWHADSILENDGEGWKQARLGFLALQPDDAQSVDRRSGDLCAVHYYIKDIEVGGTVVRSLMRGFRDSGEVFPALKNGSVADLFEPRDIDEPVAFGVLSFDAAPLVRRAQGGGYNDWTPTGDDPFEGAPDALRLRLVIARRELLGKLRTTSDWDGSTLRGLPADAANNRDLEVYEVVQRFGTDD
jgi:prepilin-type N-terminal cleavage/methylation domain-containing protein